MMSQPTTMFTSGQELANLVSTSDLLHLSWAAISDLYREEKDTNPNHPTFPVSVKHRVYQQTPYGTILAFVSWPPCTAQHFQGEEGRDLVSSTILREKFPLFEFVSTKVNPSFSIHTVAVTLFASHLDHLSVLKDQCCNISPLIITGHSIGGSIASLFTLWLLESLSPKEKHPMCITFGSPLIGDNGFQQAISERPMWNSRFLHVATNQDPIPKLFASPHNVLNIESTSHAGVYKPFGTFFLCSESGCACFEEPESVLDLMVAISSDGPNEGLQIIDYGDVLEKLKRGAIYRGISELGEWNGSPLQTGIIIQLEAIKFGRTQQPQENGDINSDITKIEERAKDLVARKRYVFDPNKKLNDMKINMTYLEWYKKESRGGYYDAFRNVQSISREEIVKRKNILAQYWDKMVKEVEKMPQKKGAFFSIAGLYAGTNYRRMVEPLDIAEFYRKGKKDYLQAERSERYKLLEHWVKDDMQEGNRSNANERNRACSLTEDSCFWAHVEEAIISCNLLKDGGTTCPEDKESSREKLVNFENYVMDLIKNYALSTETFLNQSSFMKWWADYEKVKGTSYHSSLTEYMRNRKYREYV